MDSLINRRLLFVTYLIYSLLISVIQGEIDLELSGRVEICEKGKPADVVFLLDASNSIWNPDFRRQLTFVQAVVDYFPIGQNNIKVGIATFSDDVYPQFPLNKYFTKRSLKVGIADIYQDLGSYTRTYEAIKYMRKEFFQKAHGARDSVFKIGIVITDGRSYDTARTIREAKLAKDMNIHMFSIGVGHRVDMEELRAIASVPSNHYTFQVDSYRGLHKIIDLLAIKACTVTDPPPSTTPTTTTPTTTTTTSTTTTAPTTTTTPITTPTTTTTPKPKTTPVNPGLQFETPPAWLKEHTTTKSPYEEFRIRHGSGASGEPVEPGEPGEPGNPKNPYGPGGFGSKRPIYETDGCIPDRPMDLTFVIDSKKGGTGYQKKIWKFVKNVVSNLDVKNGDVRVRFIHDCVKVPAVHLKKYASSKSKFLDALEMLRVPTKSTAILMRKLTNQLSDNTIDDRKKVGVLVTDGESGDLEATLREAQNAKLGHGIELYGVGVTDDVNEVELKALVSCSPENHLTLVSSHRKLKGVHKKLARDLCQDSS